MFASRIFWLIVLAIAAAYYFGPHPFNGVANPFGNFSIKNFSFVKGGAFTSAKPSAPAGTQSPCSTPAYGRLGDGDPGPSAMGGCGGRR